ncbi:type 1 fimbrial protein [Acinetobacter sp. C26M]|uniref:fimbrial protein n=1 Tax=unclassified Acinetobacter TaxID=196816 RepID=UPI0020366747|nr:MULTISPECIES: fimbrial protein [unclassified Acinetobacter]USA47465.1 type 1 fimbrial protein [Acinetobacter sp. C26M]USA50946.1 type 1 fimbrial protein [Acinetobacter sp. C26G]
MKIKFLTVALVTLGVANVSMAAETITFIGTIESNTCAVNVGGTASPTVTLPTVGTGDLTVSGDTAGATPFTVNLTGCSATADDVSVRFAAHNPNGTNLGVNAASTAGNVAVQLLNGSAGGNPIVFTGGIGISAQTTTSGGAASVPLTAQYYATGATTAGSVTAVADYEVIYP